MWHDFTTHIFYQQEIVSRVPSPLRAQDALSHRLKASLSYNEGDQGLPMTALLGLPRASCPGVVIRSTYFHSLKYPVCMVLYMVTLINPSV